MNQTPAVSVVMSVRNGGTKLAATIDSVLSQQGVHFEFIIVNDGSTDGSDMVLEDYAQRDGRVRVIHQDNVGLTQSLIRGCAEARGRYIARQDAGGDISLPGRMVWQFAVLEENPDIVLTSCGTRFVGPEGEFLYTAIQHGDELQQGLEELRVDRIRGPSHHGSTMFLNAAYKAVGGYRQEFWVAQDLDLWMRLVEVGRCVAIPEVLYEANWNVGSISHLRREQQVLATRAMFECRQRRRQGESERPLLDQLCADIENTQTYNCIFSGLVRSRFNYFIGSLLESQDHVAARRYLYQAVMSWPLHFKAWLKLLRLSVTHAMKKDAPSPIAKIGNPL
jgi:hypothetical protein